MSGSLWGTPYTSMYPQSSPYQGMITQAEQANQLPPNFLGSLLGAESSFNPNAVNGIHSGLGQFAPATASQYNVNPLDPLSAINGSASYLSSLQQSSGSWVTAAQQYGTLPQNLTNLNPGQQAVLQSAQAGDMIGTYGNVLTPQQTAAHSTAPAWVTSIFGSAVGLALRIVMMIIALVLLLLGIADLAFGKSVIQASKSLIKM